MKNNDDIAKDTSNLLEQKVKYKFQEESYKVVKGSMDSLKEKRKVRVHRRNIDQINNINENINNYNQYFSNENKNENYTNFNNKFEKNNIQIDKINEKRNIFIDKREEQLNKTPKLYSSLNYLNIEKESKQKKYNQSKMRNDKNKNEEKQYYKSNKDIDLDNDGIPDRIDIDDTRNAVQTSSDLYSVGNRTDKTHTKTQKRINQSKMHKNFSIGDKDDRFSFNKKNEKFSFTNDEGKNTEKIIKDKKINYQKRGNKKSIFNNPLTSSRVGERSILQKTVTSPGKLVSGAGASLKEGFNKDIEDSDMAGIQLANQIVSPLARKIRFETNTLIAKKIGFDRKAYNLSKTENKIMKVDKKLFKRKKAQRKMIRKRAMSSAGIKTSVFSRMKIAVVNTKAKIIKKIYNIGKAITTAKSLSFIIPLALLVLVPMLVIYPILAVITSAFSMESENNINNFSASSLNSDVMQWEGKVLQELKKYNLEEYKDLALVIIQLESGGRGKDIMQSSESIGLPPNSITNSNESIEVGIKHLKNCINDMNRYGVDIQTLIHSYNYGKGFIPYVSNKGGKWTQKIANDFSDKEASKLGWSSYGDKNYVTKALQYLTISGDEAILDVSFDLNGGKLAYPVPGYESSVSSSYGWRIHPIYGTRKFHTGTDIPAPTGTKVIASADGKIIEAGWKGGYGNAVMIDHGSGIITLYGHNSRLEVVAGQTVRAGQTIARVGSTGDSTGPHCHFEVRKNGEYTNPLGWLK